MITDLPTKRVWRYYSDKHFSEFLPTRWRQKLTGIDMEQNYVTVSLCITGLSRMALGEIYLSRLSASGFLL